MSSRSTTSAQLVPAGPGRADPGLPTVSILGVPVTNATKPQAVALMDAWIGSDDRRARAVFIVNAHTLNLAYQQPAYRTVLNTGDAVFGDGTGVRWAARLKGVRMNDNLVGTDLVPLFIRTSLDKGYRYFLLGSTSETVARAAVWLANEFPGIRIAGYHNGFIDEATSGSVVRMINAAAPDMLLAGMGNALQEQWIHDNLPMLEVPVSIGVGGLFDHWGGNLHRAPLWVRRLGIEWVHLLFQQPHKWRRYVLGNPKFVYRLVREILLGRLGADVNRV